MIEQFLGDFQILEVCEAICVIVFFRGGEQVLIEVLTVLNEVEIYQEDLVLMKMSIVKQCMSGYQQFLFIVRLCK